MIFRSAAFAVLVACLGTGTVSSQDTSPNGQMSSAELDKALSTMIDSMAGHPDDPQLPDGEIGASDDVLLATSPVEIADLLRTALPFARRTAKKTPRYLFSLGRAALMHGYDKLAEKLLNEAHKAGSMAALAHLGYIEESRGNLSNALVHLRTAIDGGFKSTQAVKTLAEVTRGRFKATDFSRSDFMHALHSGSGLKAFESAKGLLYLTALHEALTSDSILFLVDDPRILVEFDSRVGPLLAQKMISSPEVLRELANNAMGSAGDMLRSFTESRKSGRSVLDEVQRATEAGAKRLVWKQHLQASALHDARRLALLYGSDPRAFRAICQSVMRIVGVRTSSGSTERPAIESSPRVSSDRREWKESIQRKAAADMRRREAETRKRRKNNPEVMSYGATIPSIESFCRQVTEHFKEPREVVFRMVKGDKACVARANRDGSVSRWNIDRAKGPQAVLQQLRNADPGRRNYGNLMIEVFNARYLKLITNDFARRSGKGSGYGWVSRNSLSLEDVEKVYNKATRRGVDRTIVFRHGDHKYAVRRQKDGLHVVRFSRQEAQLLAQQVAGIAKQKKQMSDQLKRTPAARRAHLEEAYGRSWKMFEPTILGLVPRHKSLGVNDLDAAIQFSDRLQDARLLTEIAS